MDDDSRMLVQMSAAELAQMIRDEVQRIAPKAPKQLERPEQTAKRYRVTRDTIVAWGRAGARGFVSIPGGSRPCYRVQPAEFDAWATEAGKGDE